MKRSNRSQRPTTHESLEPLLTEEETARLLGWQRSTLEKRRARCLPPEYVKLGRSIRYRKQAIAALIEAGIVDPASTDTRSPAS